MDLGFPFLCGSSSKVMTNICTRDDSILIRVPGAENGRAARTRVDDKSEREHSKGFLSNARRALVLMPFNRSHRDVLDITEARFNNIKPSENTTRDKKTGFGCHQGNVGNIFFDLFCLVYAHTWAWANSQQLWITRGSEGKHSAVCSDRFSWRPAKHVQKEKLKLTATCSDLLVCNCNPDVI